MKKERVDILLVQKGLVESRQKAQALILAGKVHTTDRRIEKAGEKISTEAFLDIKGQDHPFVSRGGVKLQGALDAFKDVSIENKTAADFGASTGGFTDCLLLKGAVKVYAIDVGYGQLHPKLREDERVIVMERTNARHLKKDDFEEQMDLIVIDASFISLEKLLPSAHSILKEKGDVIALVKPQFEVGKQQIGKGGVVRDEALRQEAIDQASHAASEVGFNEKARTDCVIKGPKGNHEAFLWLQK